MRVAILLALSGAVAAAARADGEDSSAAFEARQLAALASRTSAAQSADRRRLAGTPTAKPTSSFPSGGVLVFKGNNADQFECETDPHAIDIAPVCCLPDDTCFRRTGPGFHQGCLANQWGTSLFESLSWYRGRAEISRLGEVPFRPPPRNIHVMAAAPRRDPPSRRPPR